VGGSGRDDRRRPRLAAAIGIEVARDGALSHALGTNQPPIGIELVADELSVAVLALVAAVSLATLVFARVAGPRGNSFYSGYLLLVGGLTGLVLTGDLFNMFVLRSSGSRRTRSSRPTGPVRARTPR